MTRRLLLHVGSPKCGSTFLQRVCLDNRAKLLAQGVQYPHGGEGHPGTSVDLSAIDAGLLKKWYRAAETVVLSHEDYFARAGQCPDLPERLQAAGVETEVLVFLRPFSAFIFGDYSQFLKQNLDRYIAAGAAHDGRSFERFAVERNRAITVVGYLRAWRRLLPEARLTVARHTGIRSILSDRLADVDLNWDIPPAAANPSLRMLDCDEIVAAIGRGLNPDVIRAMYRVALDKAGLPDPGRSVEREAWIEAIFARQTEEIAAEFDLDLREGG